MTTPQEAERSLQPYISEQLPPIQITNSQEYTWAAEYLKHIVKRKRELEAMRGSITRSLDEARKNTMNLFRPAITRFVDYEHDLKQAVITYERDAEAKRLAFEAELRDAQAAELAKAQEQAKELADAGQYEQAAAVVTNAAPTPIVSADTPKVSGVSTRAVYSAEVKDLYSLLEYVVEHDAYHFIQVNQHALNSLARSSRGTAKIPGVESTKGKTVVATT